MYSKDDDLSRELKPLWKALNFGQKRTRLMDDIDRDIAAGNLKSWDDAPDLIEPYPRGDVQVEGDEIERALQPGEAAFLDEGEVVSDLSDGEEQCEGDDKGPDGGAVPTGPRPGGLETDGAVPTGSRPGGLETEILATTSPTAPSQGGDVVVPVLTAGASGGARELGGANAY